MSAVQLRSGDVAADAASKAALSVFASLAPLYFVLNLKNRVGLDHLHVGLIQVLFLVVFRLALDITNLPSFILSKATAGRIEGAAAEPSGEGKKKGGGGKKGVSPLERFPPKRTDEILHRFLAIVDPEHVSRLPNGPPSDCPKQLPLSEWKVVLNEDRVSVLSHPTLPALFAISAHLPDVPLKKLFGLLVDVDARPKWDGLCEGAEGIEEVRDGAGRVASCSYLKMKGMWPVKPKDLVLLSVITRLPPSASLIPSSSDDKVMRLVCATSSVQHPSKPAQSGYNRMELKISGFMAESDGAQGSRIVQITDLSGLGSVPGFIINTVTAKIIPASLRKVGRVAKTHTSSRFGDDAKDEEWIPPILGDWKEGLDPKGPSNQPTTEGGDGDDGDDEEGAEVPPNQARSLHTLLSQLRFITTRLSALESKKQDGGKPTQGKRAWLASTLGKFVPGAGGGGSDVALASPSGGLAGLGLGLAGGVAGAATVFWLASERRRIR